MTVAEAQAVSATRARGFSIPTQLGVALIPLGFALLGVLVRYAAYAASVDDASLQGFPMGLCHWDCSWYIRIAEEGYDTFPVSWHSAAGNWAFFPLMPLFVGALRTITNIPTMGLATVVSIGLSWAAAAISWPLFERDWRAYALFSAYLLAGPFSIYFATFMTEPMFILLTVGTLVALKRRRYIEAGIWAGLTSATRIVGAFLSLALLVQAVGDFVSGGGRWKGLVPHLLKRPDILLGTALAPLGLFTYMAFLDVWIGDALAFLHVQRAWQRPQGNPLDFIWGGLTNWPQHGDWWPTSPQQLAAATLIAFALMVVLAVRRQWAELSFSFVALVTPLFAGLASMLRFISATAPLPILVCRLLARNWLVFGIALLGFIAADYELAVQWIKGALALV